MYRHRRNLLYALAFVLIWIFPVLSNAQQTELDTQEKQFSYALGIQFGLQIVSQLQSSDLPLSSEALALGIADILNQNELKLTDEQMQAVMAAVQKEIQDRDSAMREAAAQQGDDFRANFANEEGVESTASGILYKVITAGDGATPTLESTVTVHYRGTLVDGTEFDSSYRRNEPTSFPLGSIIPGWQEALQMMKVGSKWEVVIPPQLAYGENGAPPAIPPNATLVFEIELLEIQ